ncbi:hypothetical protein VNO77_23494 [Canavalia gladiata]|uniref:PGG domain-containing protein n=1 Tax=Canavalia gladiata TaxID=3824 RepID=A0AAN9L4I6_CANGL
MWAIFAFIRGKLSKCVNCWRNQNPGSIFLDFFSPASESMDPATPEAPVAVVVQEPAATNTEPQLTRVASALHRRPPLDYIENSRETMKIFFTQCVPLYKYALEGNWQEAKQMIERNPMLKEAAISTGWTTVLHVAAGTNHYYFVDELLKLLYEHGKVDGNRAIELQDKKGNTAFCFAAASGNWGIAHLMLTRNSNLVTIRGGDGMTPVQFAALQGRCPMACRLYPETKNHFNDEDWKLLFFTCIKTRNYDLALKMVSERSSLAFAQDDGGNGIALHLLAQHKKPLDSCCHCSQHPVHIRINPAMKQDVFLQLVNFLWNTIIRDIGSKTEMLNIIRQPTQLLFDATEVGNFGFLSELISAYPALIWESDSNNLSIIHKAVSNRHASIYNVIHEIGFIKDIIVTYEAEEDKNTLLHLAAKSAPPSQLELISGAAFQMSLEISWFEEVKKIMPPSFIRMKNGKDLTAQELFTQQHAELRKNAEAWMKRTAEFCMLIATVISTGVFSAAISIPGGMDDDTKKPNYLSKSPFLVFAISDAIALISSATAIVIFLSILVSRYAEYDFHKSLPRKLIYGLITLFISITSMMVAFGSSFFIMYYHSVKWVPGFISAFACLPILLFIFLQWSLWSDIISSAYYCKTLFKPGKKMIYVVHTREEETIHNGN